MLQQNLDLDAELPDTKEKVASLETKLMDFATSDLAQRQIMKQQRQLVENLSKTMDKYHNKLHEHGLTCD